MSHKVLGFTEDYTNCDCCGKTKLKGTYAVQYDDGEIIHFGSRCIKARHAFNRESDIKHAISETNKEIIRNAKDKFAYMGGYDMTMELTKLEFDTPEHTELWDRLTELQKEIKKEFCTEYLKNIHF